jgi:Family of unknown function (DUF5989)
VSQTCSLPGSRTEERAEPREPQQVASIAGYKPAIQQTTSLRYARAKIWQMIPSSATFDSRLSTLDRPYSCFTGVKIESHKSEFEQAAAQAGQAGFFSDLWGFMKENKKWWLMPLIAVFLVFALLIFLSSTGLAPFIYTLF